MSSLLLLLLLLLVVVNLSDSKQQLPLWKLLALDRHKNFNRFVLFFRMLRISKQKFCTDIYVTEYGNNEPNYVGFAISTKSEINNKLNELNKSLTKTYWLEHEFILNNLFPSEMIVPIRKNTIRRIQNGYDIINYIGPACNYVDEKVRKKIQKLSEKSLVKAYVYLKDYVDWNDYYENLSTYIAYELEIRGFNNLNNLHLYNFEDDSHLQLVGSDGSQ